MNSDANVPPVCGAWPSIGSKQVASSQGSISQNSWGDFMFSLEQEWFLRAPALAAQACLDKVREKVGHSLLQFDFVVYILVLCLIIFWSS